MTERILGGFGKFRRPGGLMRGRRQVPYRIWDFRYGNFPDDITFTRSQQRPYRTSDGRYTNSPTNTPRLFYEWNGSIYARVGWLIERETAFRLRRSDDYQTAAWNLNGGQETITPGYVESPLDGSFGSLIAATGTAGKIGQTVTVIDGTAPHNFGQFLRGQASDWARLEVSTPAGDQVAAWFDVRNGTVGSVQTSGSNPPSVYGVQIERWSNRGGQIWWRPSLGIEFPVNAGNTINVEVAPVPANEAPLPLPGNSLSAWRANLSDGLAANWPMQTVDTVITRVPDIGYIDGVPWLDVHSGSLAGQMINLEPAGTYSNLGILTSPGHARMDHRRNAAVRAFITTGTPASIEAGAALFNQSTLLMMSWQTPDFRFWQDDALLGLDQGNIPNGLSGAYRLTFFGENFGTGINGRCVMERVWGFAAYAEPPIPAQLPS